VLGAPDWAPGWDPLGGASATPTGSRRRHNKSSKTRRKMPVEVKVLIGVALTSLAGAAVLYIAFLVAVDEVRKDIKSKRHGRRK
jgi:hypothetical protein